MPGLPIILEVSVAILLIITAVYCAILERRMRMFRAGQEHLRGLVSDLDAATRRAEQAICGLARTTAEAEAALAQKISDARTLSLSLMAAAGGGEGAARRPRPRVREGAER